MKKPVLIGLLIFAALMGLLVYSTLTLGGTRVEICMAFNGHQSCRTASGSTREQAQRTALQNACAEIASGVTDSLACERSEPVKITYK